jgi:hypothetical protein
MAPVTGPAASGASSQCTMAPSAGWMAIPVVYLGIAQAMRDASICGLGQTAASAIESAIREMHVFEPQGAA